MNALHSAPRALGGREKGIWHVVPVPFFIFFAHGLLPEKKDVPKLFVFDNGYVMSTSDEMIVRLLSQHDRGIRAFVLALSGQPRLVDDIMQDVSVVIWRRRDDYDPAQSFGAWARGIARLITFESLRREHKVPMVLEASALEAMETWFSAREQGSTSATASDERLDALARCREGLSDSNRDFVATALCGESIRSGYRQRNRPQYARHP